MSRDRRLVPNRFIVQLAGVDLERLQGYDDAMERELVDQLKDIPIGTWFEFLEPGANRPIRAKLTWLSRITHNALFVNQRGHKTAEMLLEELAVAISEGRIWIQQENKQGIFERAFENMIASLRNFLPGGQGKNNE